MTDGAAGIRVCYKGRLRQKLGRRSHSTSTIGVIAAGFAVISGGCIVVVLDTAVARMHATGQIARIGRAGWKK